ncbi:Response regulators consisting of a CheY-like receiver domain and a winged-helix DNA-binding domain [Cupriavidus gilardii J11]|uniref:Response regulators consisting of a CheY-like receiver domain and a winged-helix DNA-binding domain n=1 Tax=Cupriavidus gilardii J11 TaxID=936133 RepID=A0A562BTG6_9BURK|nr:response regulator [Cupriavidus gilardii]TWG88454.1 Response regulators consisting of a CheY-like receiver domain and a winged-helix DNA-binding domain [Cupriavidus gilardii J11]
MRTVLVVDDDPAIASATAMALSHAGYAVETAEDGLAGFAAAQRVHPSVVVTDWMMPRADGAMLCHLMLGDASLSRTPIVVFTSNSAAPSLPNPCVAYCRKPCAPERLLDVIQELIEKDEAAQE